MANTRFKGANASERLTLSTLSDSDMFQIRHLPGTVNDADKGVSKSLLQSIPFGVSTTAASTAAKIAALSDSCPDFNLVSGREIVVYFSEANTAANPTLNFEGTGAIPIYNPNGSPVGSWLAGIWLQLKYFEVEIGGNTITRWLAMSPVASDGEIGDVKAISYMTVPDGWLECNGQAVSRTTYQALFNKYNTQKYDGTHTLLSLYGTGDGTSTFNLPDYREVALVGAGQNDKDSIATHDVYTVGQFKDDVFQNHNHTITVRLFSGAGTYVGTNLAPGVANNVISEATSWETQTAGDSGSGNRTSTVTRGKRKGVKYIIKVL